MHAIARLVLHPHVTSIQTSWVKMGREGAAAANLRDLDHFHQQRWQGVRVFVQSQIAAEDERHAAKRHLRDIGGSIEVNGPIAGG